MEKKYTELSNEEKQRALDLHKKTIVVNALSYMPGRENFQRYCDIMIEGGITAVNPTVASTHSLNEACKLIADTIRNVNSCNRKVTIVTSVEEIRKAKVEGFIGIIFGFQNTTPLEGDVKLVELFHRLGVRVIQLTYSWSSLTGDGCYERTDGGLTRFGIDVIDEMNRLGILLDLSHCGPKTTLEAIEASRYPPAFTHNAARAINDFERNKSDEEIKAMAEKGGVIGIIAESNFIKHEGGLTGTTLDDYLDHIDYVMNLVGIDHVGVGGDIDEFLTKEDVDKARERNLILYEQSLVKYPDHWYRKNQYQENMYVNEYNTMAKTFSVTKGLVARGYSDQDIMKIQGGNFLKLFEKVWGK